MTIPELKNYNGCKGGNGVYQQIISIIPPHNILVVPFLGHCGIVRNILPSDILIGVDASAKVINAWKKYLIKYLIYKYKDDNKNILIKTNISKGNLPSIIHLYNDDALIFLKNKLPGLISKYEDTPVIYLDPPYPLSSRKSTAKLYDFEMTDCQHQNLLSIIIKMKYLILISSYDNKMYNDSLPNWFKLDFPVGTRNGKAIETVYYNYSLSNGLLHDYRYLGNDFKDRERIRLKISRWVKGLEKLEAREQMAIIKSIIQKDGNNNNIHFFNDDGHNKAHQLKNIKKSTAAKIATVKK